jgi:hypothetical protein
LDTLLHGAASYLILALLFHRELAECDIVNDFGQCADAAGLLCTYSIVLRQRFKGLIGTDPIESLLCYGSSEQVLHDLHTILAARHRNLLQVCISCVE